MKTIIVIFVVAVGLYFGWKNLTSTTATNALPASGEITTAKIGVLASRVKPGDVVAYCTSECPYCAEMRGWLNQNGFAFTECDLRTNRQCESEYNSFGGNGTPYLVVRGHHMRGGFDSDEFLAALSKKQ